MILDALSTQSHGDAPGSSHAPAASGGTRAATTDELRRLVPGIGDAAAVHLATDHFAAGRTLKQTNLRGQTGASVIAIQRDGQPVFPDADVTLRPGNTLVVTGTADAVDAARILLASGPS